LRLDYSIYKNPAISDSSVDIKNQIQLPTSNFDPGLLTSVLMTGTTALVRSTAERMETKGISYPGEKIGKILKDADLTHVSNEVSFTPNCPKPDPWFINLRFCSNPAYIQLLEQMGVDIVELTGNHLLDYNSDAFQYSYDLYKKEGWKTFGGGLTLEAAREPLIIEHHGNRIAFIGCNPVGPDYVWATEKSPGAAPCDFEAITAKIKKLSEQGILVIATLQDQENYEAMPLAEVKQHLDALAEAGAVVVSGSQSHFPQGFSFSSNGLVHYGLGNLFFDQMDYPVVGTRREFYDKHFFYNGKYISTEVLTGMLEDYAQPRPMTLEERQQFLSDIFTASGW
jgi:Bacterial capsule synthesis protein PGA_cap